jgi:hypothetical protein
VAAVLDRVLTSRGGLVDECRDDGPDCHCALVMAATASPIRFGVIQIAVAKYE